VCVCDGVRERHLQEAVCVCVCAHLQEAAPAAGELSAGDFEFLPDEREVEGVDYILREVRKVSLVETNYILREVRMVSFYGLYGS